MPAFPLPGRRRQNQPSVDILGTHFPLFKKPLYPLTPFTIPSLSPPKLTQSFHQIYRIFLRISPWLWFSPQSDHPHWRAVLVVHGLLYQDVSPALGSNGVCVGEAFTVLARALNRRISRLNLQEVMLSR